MKKQLKSLCVLAVGCLAFYLLIKYIRPFGIDGELVRHWVRQRISSPVFGLVKTTVASPFIFCAVALTLILEKLMPADRKQKIFSVSFFQDFIWYFYEAILHAAILSTYVYWLKGIYNTQFSMLTVYAVQEWPHWGRFAFGVLLTDFLYWLQHYINHKFEWLWQMHTVHHSQKHINFFTDFRYHIVEYMVRHTVLVIPFLILEVDIPTIVWFNVIKTQFTHFYHGNIKTNFGPLKYILVTPQSHRIHHSRLPEHRDKNFGALFSIWDFMFKTQYMGFDEYPETGIGDEDFPHERSVNPFKLVTVPLVQLFYPFKVIGRSIVRKWVKSGP